MSGLHRDCCFGKVEIRLALIIIYNGVCQIGNCKRKSLSKEDRAKTKIITFEHIYPRTGDNTRDSLDNGTISCEYCNTDKGATILLFSRKKKERTLHEKLINDAQENKMRVIRFLMNKRFGDQTETKRFYRIKILSFIYDIERHKNGFVTILAEHSKQKIKRMKNARTHK
jgi:hypothetical protein